MDNLLTVQNYSVLSALQNHSDGEVAYCKDEDKYSLSYSQVEVLKGAYRDKKIEKLENRIEVLENERTSS